MTRRNPEEQFQRSVAELLDNLGWLWWHTPNGGWRTKAEAGRFRAAGVKAGVADVIIAETWVYQPGYSRFVGRIAHSGYMIAIELKAGKNTTTKAQRDWLADVRAHGWLTAVCHNMDEVMAVCRMVMPANGRRLR